jgi:hypothetical protein
MRVRIDLSQRRRFDALWKRAISGMSVRASSHQI